MAERKSLQGAAAGITPTTPFKVTVGTTHIGEEEEKHIRVKKTEYGG